MESRDSNAVGHSGPRPLNERPAHHRIGGRVFGNAVLSPSPRNVPLFVARAPSPLLAERMSPTFTDPLYAPPLLSPVGLLHAFEPNVAASFEDILSSLVHPYSPSALATSNTLIVDAVRAEPVSNLSALEYTRASIPSHGTMSPELFQTLYANLEMQPDCAIFLSSPSTMGPGAVAAAYAPPHHLPAAAFYPGFATAEALEMGTDPQFTMTKNLLPIPPSSVGEDQTNLASTVAPRHEHAFSRTIPDTPPTMAHSNGAHSLAPLHGSTPLSRKIALHSIDTSVPSLAFMSPADSSNSSSTTLSQTVTFVYPPIVVARDCFNKAKRKAPRGEPCNAADILTEVEKKAMVQRARTLQNGTFVRCGWDGCNTTVQSDQLMLHLRGAHQLSDTAHGDPARMKCKWARCKRTHGLKKDSLEKHLFSKQHLDARSVCESCGREFSRSDALGRHLKRLYYGSPTTSQSTAQE